MIRKAGHIFDIAGGMVNGNVLDVNTGYCIIFQVIDTDANAAGIILENLLGRYNIYTYVLSSDESTVFSLPYMIKL